MLRPYLYVAAAAGLIAALIYSYSLGHSRASAACEAANLRVALAAAKVDLQAAEHQQNQLKKRAAEAESLERLARERIDALAEEVSGRDGGACLLNDADARRLREF